jgi:cysteine desulfurase
LLRARLEAAILAGVPGASATASGALTTAGTCHLLFGDDVESEALLLLLDDAGVCASAGSACASGAIEPSHVLTAMGIADRIALSSLRLSLGWSTTDDEIDLAAKVVPDAVARLRGTGR